MVSFSLCTRAGRLLGTTPEMRMPRAPGWNDTRPLVALARREWALDAVVLRLIDAAKRDGIRHLRYAVEISRPPTVALVPSPAGDFADEPLRQAWARPGGPARQLEWAARELAARGTPMTGDPEQVRSWNLSSLWRLPHRDGAAWLKAVPSFFAHEGAVIERLHGYDVPRLISRSEGVCLLDDIPGDDLHRAPLGTALRMVDTLVDIQRGTVADAALRSVLPDWRLSAIAEGAIRVLERWAAELSSGERAAVAGLVDGLDERAGRLQDCGLPDGLVHGDFHPGNVRGTSGRLTLLDWGDSGLGHPLLDVAAFTERMSAADADAVVAHWTRAWRAAVPGSDPQRALTLIEPVAALRQAVVYQQILDRIEPAERRYFTDDPVLWLRRTALAVERHAAAP